MERQEKQHFIELPSSGFKKKYYSVPLFLLESKMQRNKRNLQEIKLLIAQQGLQYIGFASDERQILIAKHKESKRISLLQLKQFNHKSKCIYLSMNITSCLKMQIRQIFQMKTWKLQNKVLFQDDRTGRGLALIEFNFAQHDLRTFMQSRELMKNQIKWQELKVIVKDLIENLCQYHLQNYIIKTITPQTILFENSHWFILCGDDAELITQDICNKINQPISAPSSGKYSFPLQSSVSKEMNSGNTQGKQSKARHFHNVYKSDVYLLGLCLLQLSLVNKITHQQIEQVFLCKRDLISIYASKCDQVLRQNFIIKSVDNSALPFKFYRIPNYLEEMLQPSEADRPYIFEICLMTNFTSPLLDKFKVPFESFFKSSVEDIPNSINRKRISYSHAGLQYEGEADFDKGNRKNIRRQGRGSLYFNGVKTIQCEWKNNNPHRRCEVKFNEILSYEGEILNYKLHGNGYLRFNQIAICGPKWYKNLLQQKSGSQNQSQKSTSQLNKTLKVESWKPTSGVYLFVGVWEKQQLEKQNIRVSIDHDEQSFPEFKVFYTSATGKNNQTAFNLVLLKKHCISIARWIASVLIESEASVEKIKIKGIENQSLYGQQKCEELQLVINIKNESRTVIFTTDLNFTIPFLLSFLKQGCKIINCKLSIQMIEATNVDFLRDQIITQILNFISKIQSITITSCKNVSDTGFCKLFKSINHYSCCFRAINFSNTRVGQKTLAEMLYWNGLAKLKYLNLSGCEFIEEQMLAELLTNPQLIQLQTLNLAQTNFSNKIVNKMELMRPGFLKRLKQLDIGICSKLSENSIQSFLKNPGLFNLKHLSVKSCNFKDNILQAIQNANFQLEYLNLSGCINLTLSGLWSFFSHQKLDQLKYLNLSYLSIDDRFLSCLSNHCNSQSLLSHLVLDQCRLVSDKGFNNLLKSNYLVNVNTLSLKKTRINNSTLACIAEGNIKCLKRLDISKCNNVTDEGLCHLVQSQTFSQIQQLDITSTPTKGIFINYLCHSKFESRLRKLVLNDCKLIPESFLSQLLASNIIAQLYSLDLSGTNASDSSIDAFNNNLSVCKRIVNIRFHGCKNVSVCKLKINKQVGNLFSRGFAVEEGIGEINDLCQSNYLLKITQLELNSSTQELKQMNRIFNCPQIVNLQTLALKAIQINSLLHSLSYKNFATNLTNISLFSCTFQESILINFLKSSHAWKLKKLDLGWTECSNQVLYALAEIKIRLNSINLTRCIKVNDKGMVKYLSSASVENLTQLDLRSTLITNNTIQTIGSSKYAQNIKKLVVRACSNIRQISFKCYLNSKNAKPLEYLDISWTNFEGDIWSILSNCKNTLSNFHTLILSGVKIQQSHFVKFLCSDNSSSLCTLDISFTSVNAELFHNFDRFKCVDSLQRLYLNGIAVQTIKRFVDCLQKNNNVKQIFIEKSEGIQKSIQHALAKLKKLQRIVVQGFEQQERDRLAKKLKTDRIQCRCQQTK